MRFIVRMLTLEISNHMGQGALNSYEGHPIKKNVNTTVTLK